MLKPVCPSCGSEDVDMEDYDGGINYYHCSKCGIWYDENGIEDS